MAPRGKKCPSCGTTMYALEEQDQPMGIYVTYLCNNGSCRMKVKEFEGK